ncbi:MAG: hypothetical protein K0S71_776 [Clostridia bacterium]|jgi:hypothetical protein|nr:hypothetical protein [Clostridia bacterium]
MKNKYLINLLRGILLVILLLGLYGCGAKKGDYSTRQESSTAAEKAKSDEKMMNDVATEAAEMPQESGSIPEEETRNTETPNINTEVGYSRKIIKTGELQLQTKDFKKCVEDVVAKVQSLKGYVESSNVQGNSIYDVNSSTRRASIVIRIPQKHFDSFINESSKFGNVVYTTSNSDDITSAYVDTEIRLKSLKTRHERLLVLLEQSGSLKDLFAIEQELGNVTYEIEKLSGQLKQYDQLVDMSTITIQIEEVYKIEEMKPVITFGDKIASTFKGSVEGLITFLEGLFLVLVGITPFLIIIVPIAILILIIYKKHGKSKKIREEKPKEEK